MSPLNGLSIAKNKKEEEVNHLLGCSVFVM